MKIISFWAKSNDFEVDEIHFSSNPTLLVGESGAGKSQILKALLMLKSLATKEDVVFSTRYGRENSVPIGFEWELNFEIKKINYKWKGSIQKGVGTVYDAFTPQYIIESLYQNDKLIFERIDDKKSTFNGNNLPNGLIFTNSFIYQFKHDEVVKLVHQAFIKIQHYDMTRERERIYFKQERLELNNYKTIAELISSNLSILEKIFIASGGIQNISFFNKEDGSIELYRNNPHKFDIFSKIENDFKNIFPNVTFVFISITSDHYFNANDKNLYLRITIQLNNGKSIHQENISSGMLRTLYHLAEIYLSPPETVILIDEFENSLGTNCMDVLVDGIIHQNKNVQYIITSHHPYIINNIPYQYWKIVQHDENGVVKTKNGVELIGMGKSRQSAYSQLMKLQNHED